MTQLMLMDRLNLSRKQIQKVIKELQEQSILEREGFNRNGRWIVKKFYMKGEGRAVAWFLKRQKTKILNN